MEGYPVHVLHRHQYVETSNPFPVMSTFYPSHMDAFGRLRISQPLTLFDSSSRYYDNTDFFHYTSNQAYTLFNSNQGCATLYVGSNQGDRIYRETSKVFAYQPGKSLLVMESFTFNPLTNGLRQRVGYFDTSNGIYFQAENSNISFVKRSAVSGIVTETVISQSQWNYDTFDGKGISKKTLDITRSQILFIDIEWLGVGTVRTGFVIDGQYLLCHRFHHANTSSTLYSDTTLPYMTTACLPVRYELENIASTGINRTSRMLAICATVLSEGGYEIRGKPGSIGWTILDAPRDIPAKNTLYPILALRLKAYRLGAIVVPREVSLINTVAGDCRWAIVLRATVTGGTWNSLNGNSSVEYNLEGTNPVTDGIIVRQGYFTATTNSSAVVSLDATIFRYQLERNSFTNTPLNFVVALASSDINDKVLVSVDWEELS
jgi:hypothetical protein